MLFNKMQQKHYDLIKAQFDVDKEIFDEMSDDELNEEFFDKLFTISSDTLTDETTRLTDDALIAVEILDMINETDTAE